MRNLLLGLAIGIASLLVGGTTVALVGIAVLAPLAAALLALRRPPSRQARLRLRPRLRRRAPALTDR